MSGNEAERFFDHFGLPRELRDQIYDEVLATEPPFDLGKKNGLCYAVEHAAILRLALVSHQFGEECRKRAQQTACLVLEDTIKWSGSEAEIVQLPHAYLHVANLQLLLMNTGGEWAHKRHDEDRCSTLGSSSHIANWSLLFSCSTHPFARWKWTFSSIPSHLRRNAWKLFLIIKTALPPSGT
ncbi:hypothetical protein LTR85_001931 [Meristemomyces frigidus]|nr:hypothetical protein LTR85_001931 [Meristemomyces frigidus]